MRYRKGFEVKTVADEIIAHGCQHDHLNAAPVLYVFRETAEAKKGKIVWGTAQVLSGLNALYARAAFRELSEEAEADVEEHDEAETGGGLWADTDDYATFLITIAFDIWRVLTPEWRRWLVNHELSHCRVDEKTGRLSTVAHDIELFYTDAPILGMTPGQFRNLFKAIEVEAMRMTSGDTAQTQLAFGPVQCRTDDREVNSAAKGMP